MQSSQESNQSFQAQDETYFLFNELLRSQKLSHFFSALAALTKNQLSGETKVFPEYRHGRGAWTGHHTCIAPCKDDVACIPCLCKLSLHTSGFLGQLGLLVPQQQLITPLQQWKFREQQLITKGFVLLCSSCRGVCAFLSIQRACGGVGQAAQNTSCPIGRTWGSQVFPRGVWFAFQSRSSPQGSSQILHPSLFPCSQH